MSVQGVRKKGPYREDLMVLAVTAVMVFTLYGAVDYPNTIANIPPGGGGGGGGHNQTNVTHIVEEPVADESGYTNEGQSTNVDVKVPWGKLLWVNATLTWADDFGNNDQFQLVVTSGGVELGKGTGSTGSIAVNMEGPISGNYTVVISCLNAPGIVGPSPINRDQGNSWTLKATAVREVEG
jgi:hypothetical protein